METKARVLAVHVWFAIAGLSWDTPSSGGPVGRDTKPPADAADTGGDDLWFPLGIIEDCNVEGGPANVIDIRKPNPGKKVLYRQIETNPDLKHMLTCKEGSLLFHQLLKGTAALGIDPTATAIQYNPMEGKFLQEGWLKTQAYDTDDNLVDSCDVYGALRVSGAYSQNGENIDYQLEHTTWYSQYNTGVLLPA